MLSSISATIPADKSLPARVADLTLLRAVLDGTLYDKLGFDFHEDSKANGDYVPVHHRRPSVRYNLCKIVVNDSVALLFGDGRFPTIVTGDADADAVIADIIDETGLCEVMQEAAFRGSVGSIAILMRVLDGRLFYDVMDTTYLTPTWNPKAPDTLQSVTEKYKIQGSDVAAMGHSVTDADMGAWYWFQRIWDCDAESRYIPWKVADQNQVPLIDEAESVQHELGFVPIVWIKNLPSADPIDGACTFTAAIDTQIEIEYQLSQAGRGLKYSSDPLLLLKEPANSELDGPIVRSAANAVIVSEKGDGKLLEINGTASAAVVEYVKALREMAMETIHGNRSSADKANAAQSGRALEMLHQPLIWLADKLRTSYGTRGLLPLIRMAAAARSKMAMKLFGDEMSKLPKGHRYKLHWPPWFHPTIHDMGQTAARISGLYGDGLLSRETALTNIQTDNGIQDIKAEATAIDAETAAKDARAAALGAKVAATETLTP